MLLANYFTPSSSWPPPTPPPLASPPPVLAHTLLSPGAPSLASTHPLHEGQAMPSAPHPPWLVYLLHHCAGLDVGTRNDGGLYAYDDDALTSLWMDDGGQCVAEWAGTLEEGSIQRKSTDWREAASELARAVYEVVGYDPDYMALIDLRDDLPWRMDLPTPLPPESTLPHT